MDTTSWMTQCIVKGSTIDVSVRTSCLCDILLRGMCGLHSLDRQWTVFQKAKMMLSSLMASNWIVQLDGDLVEVNVFMVLGFGDLA